MNTALLDEKVQVPKTAGQTVTLGKLLGGQAAQIETVLDDVLALHENVGTKPFGPLSRQLKVKPGSVPVFKGQSLKVDANAGASIEIHSPGEKARAFGLPEDADGFLAPRDTSFAELNLDGGFSADGEGSAQSGFLTFSLGLKAGADLKYRHLLPVSAGQTKLEGLEGLVQSSRFPQLALLDLELGEVHEMTAPVFLDLRVKGGIEGNADFIGELFSGLPSEVGLHVQYGVEAALGLGLYERMKITAGRALLLNPDWVRLRVERESQKKLTFGAHFALAVQYDLSKGLESLLEQALELSPIPLYIDSLKKVQAVVAPFAAGDLDGDQVSSVHQDGQ